MTRNPENLLDRLFAIYRAALVDFEPSPAFVASVWARIEARRQARATWESYLLAWSPRLALASIAAAALLWVAFSLMPGAARSDDAVLDDDYVGVLTLNSIDEDEPWLVAGIGQ